MDYLNIKKNDILPVVEELNLLLAEYHIYYQKLRSFHWNIVGKNFFDLHVKFEELYGDARLKIDEIAERILTLKHHPVSNYSDYLRNATIQEESFLKRDAEMVRAILNDHKQLFIQMKNVMDQAEKAEDEGTLDIMGGYIASLEKSSWMLNAWLTSGNAQLETTLLEEATKA